MPTFPPAARRDMVEQIRAIKRRLDTVIKVWTKTQTLTKADDGQWRFRRCTPDELPENQRDRWLSVAMTCERLTLELSELASEARRNADQLGRNPLH